MLNATEHENFHADKSLIVRNFMFFLLNITEHENFPDRKGKRKVQGVPQSQTAALSRHQEEDETDITKQAKIEQTKEKH